jgi:hypothetical protein
MRHLYRKWHKGELNALRLMTRGSKTLAFFDQSISAALTFPLGASLASRRLHADAAWAGTA